MSEFSRPARVDAIGGEAREIAIEADADERAALAERLGIVRLDALTATASVARIGGEVRASGRLSARLVQACVATNAELPAAIDAGFSVVFRNEVPVDVPDAGLELSDADCDVVFYEGGAVDLGEAVAETLALEIDPYPRAADADAVLREAGVLSEGMAGPFAVLAGLKRTNGTPA